MFGNRNVDIKNLPKSFASIKFLINQSDDMYLNQDHIEFIDFFKKISKNDKCVQNFTNETAIPYLLKKTYLFKILFSVHFVITRFTKRSCFKFNSE